MIKLVIEDKTLADLDAALLPYVSWKSLKLSDLDNVSDSIISDYSYAMNTSVVKSLLKNNRINIKKLSDEHVMDMIENAYMSNFNIFDYIQLPYHLIKHILDNDILCNRYATKMADTQSNMPMKDAIKHFYGHSLDGVLYNNSNPALIDYLFSTDGINTYNELKYKPNINFITSTEAKKLGLNIKNRTINTEVLRRAGACDAGQNYCKKILSELNVESIKWDDAIMMIRNDPKLHNRAKLREYMMWIVNSRP